MEQDIKKIGQMLKSKREELKFSLKEVESTTSIRSSYLQAIEEGLHDKFLSNVYMYGFIRQYASFLELDATALAQVYPDVFTPAATSQSEFAYGIGTLEVRGSLGGGIKWLTNAMWAGSAVVGLLLFWYLCKYFGLI